MNTATLFTFLFLATAPLGLMPAIIALFLRHPARMALLLGNLALWVSAYFAVRADVVDGAGVTLSAPVALACWLGLFAHVIRSRPQASRPAAREQQDP
jgi:hypothetical protein